VSVEQPARIVPKSVVVSEVLRTELKQYLCYLPSCMTTATPDRAGQCMG